MIRCPDNQINTSFIDILRIKWLVFLLWLSFFRTTSTVASSEAPADYQPAPGRMDGVPERHQRQLQQNRSWIKGLGKNPQKSELIHWRQCLLSGGTEACSLGLRETPSCIHVIQHLSQPRVACWHGFRQNSKNGMHVYTLSDRRSEKKIACIYGLRSEGVNTVLPCINIQDDFPVPQTIQLYLLTYTKLQAEPPCNDQNCKHTILCKHTQNKLRASLLISWTPVTTQIK